MLASRIFEQKIMNLIPFLIVLYIDLTSPGFFSVMYRTWMGRGVMTMCLAAYGAHWFWPGRYWILRCERQVRRTIKMRNRPAERLGAGWAKSRSFASWPAFS